MSKHLTTGIRWIALFAMTLALLVGSVPQVVQAEDISLPLYRGLAQALNLTAENRADAPVGSAAWRAIASSSAKEVYLTPAMLGFTGPLTVAEIDSISYATNKTGGPGDVDWTFSIYTVKEPESASWFGYRLNAEPYFAIDNQGEANQWNVWSSEDGTNQLRFFDQPTAGYYGNYTDPTLNQLKESAYTWTRPDNSTVSVDYRDKQVMFFRLSTGSAWSSTFDGLLDNITISAQGNTVVVDLENLPAAVYVDDDWTGRTLGESLGGDRLYGSNAFSSISAAVTEVAPGGTVNVAAGTYNEENIQISKGLTLQGAGAATTIIAPSAVTNNSTISVTNPSGDVKIDGFAFQMQPKPGYGSAISVSGTNIAIDSATVTISNNVVTGSADGSTADYGFYGQNNNAKLVITDNVINKTGDNSICMENQYGSSEVANNTISISDNVDYDPYFSMSYGNIHVTTPQIVSGNTFYLDHAGTGYSTAVTFSTAPRYSWYGGTYASETGGYANIQITDNVIYTGGAQAKGIAINDRSATAGSGTITGVVITGNTVDGENAADLNTNGIKFNGNVQSALIRDNTIQDVLDGIIIARGANNELYPSNTTLESNRITSTTRALTWEGTSTLDASPNWFGSAGGPPAGTISGNVTSTPWCAAADCLTFAPNDDQEIILPTGSNAGDIQTALNNAPQGSIIVIPSGSGAYTQIGGFQITTPNLTIRLADGTIIQNSSPCFEVKASHTSIVADSIGGAVCVPTGTSNGIDVDAGLTDITIEGLEIEGSQTSGTADGINFSGTVSDVVIANNYIHGLPGDGIYFTAQPAGVVEIQGNLFTDNDGWGIHNFEPAATATIDAQFNAWGDVAGANGPAGDGVSPLVDTSNWTHVDLYMTASDTPLADNTVAAGETITYTVSGNFANATGAQFKLLYPDENLEVQSSSLGSIFTNPIPTVPASTVLNTSTPGEISFAGTSSSAVSGEDQMLFTVTFKAIASGSAALDLDMGTDSFAMAPGYGPSNLIIANDMADGSLTVVTAQPPALTSTTLAGPYVADSVQEFQVTLTNPVDGNNFNPVIFRYVVQNAVLADITSFQYLAGTTWMDMPMSQSGLDVVGYYGPATGFPIAPGYSATTTFRIQFKTAKSYPVAMTLNDMNTAPETVLATLAQTAVVNANVTGTVSMQGRTARAGVPFTLTGSLGSVTFTSTSWISGNLSFPNLAAGTYTITTHQPRYLNITSDLLKTITISGTDAIAPLELKGGNANWTDNVIDINDASRVGGVYGQTLSDDDGDVNFSGKVDIFDLALVGGNFDLTSAAAYSSTHWVP